MHATTCQEKDWNLAWVTYRLVEYVCVCVCVRERERERMRMQNNGLDQRIDFSPGSVILKIWFASYLLWEYRISYLLMGPENLGA